jgi:hypothetical protein
VSREGATRKQRALRLPGLRMRPTGPLDDDAPASLLDLPGRGVAPSSPSAGQLLDFLWLRPLDEPSALFFFFFFFFSALAALAAALAAAATSSSVSLPLCSSPRASSAAAASASSVSLPLQPSSPARRQPVIYHHTPTHTHTRTLQPHLNLLIFCVVSGCAARRRPAARAAGRT